MRSYCCRTGTKARYISNTVVVHYPFQREASLFQLLCISDLHSVINELSRQHPLHDIDTVHILTCECQDEIILPFSWQQLSSSDTLHEQTRNEKRLLLKHNAKRISLVNSEYKTLLQPNFSHKNLLIMDHLMMKINAFDTSPTCTQPLSCASSNEEYVEGGLPLPRTTAPTKLNPRSAIINIISLTNIHCLPSCLTFLVNCQCTFGT